MAAADAVLVQKIVMTPVSLKSLHDQSGELLQSWQMLHGPLG